MPVAPVPVPISARVSRLQKLLSLIQPVPEDWFAPSNSTGSPGTDMECRACDNYRTLQSAWRKAMKWTDGLDCALSVMLASVTSTKSIGDQLWIKIIGPAACGKSTLCEALSINRKFILAKSTIRGFHSGYKSDGSGEEDNSLVSQLYDKTLVTKDGDTLLQSPNLGQILAEARDLYDSTSRTHYRNKMSRDYQGVRMTWILCGTSSLRSIDSSELGERFLDCVIMESIDDELEDEILWRVANRADRNLCLLSDGKPETHHDPELVEAMRLTGGYVSYLRDNAGGLLSQVDLEDDAKLGIVRLGKFVAYMRARPSKRQDESAEREFAARLVSQHIRLAKCIAVVLNRRRVDEEVMRRVRKVALDTARGQTLKLTDYLYKAGDTGLETKTLALYTNRTEDQTRKLLRFLRDIGVVGLFSTKVQGLSVTPKWRLTPTLFKLYHNLFGVPDA